MKGFNFRLSFSIFLFLLSNTLHGQDFEVAPVLVNFTANPGESQSKILTIRNHSPEKQKFTLNLSDYLLNESGDKVQKTAGTTDRTLFNWLTINPSFITLNPNESAEVELNINVPRDGFNTRWGIIHVQAAKEQTPASADKQLATGVIIVPRIVVLLNQNPKPNS